MQTKEYKKRNMNKKMPGGKYPHLLDAAEGARKMK